MHQVQLRNRKLGGGGGGMVYGFSPGPTQGVPRSTPIAIAEYGASPSSSIVDAYERLQHFNLRLIKLRKRKYWFLPTI